MKVKASKRTRQCRLLTWIFEGLHFLCLFGPLLYFIPYGYATGDTVSKVAMSFTVVVAIILLVMSVLVSVTARADLHRTIMWVLIAGVLFALTDVQAFIWIMAITSILDELVFTKVRDYYKHALLSNKEIDRRN